MARTKEFSYDPKTKLYRKRITLPDGTIKSLRSKGPDKLREEYAALKSTIKAGRYNAENPTLMEYAVR